MISLEKLTKLELLTEKQQQSIFGGVSYRTSLANWKDVIDDRDNSGTLSPGDLIQIWPERIIPDSEWAQVEMGFAQQTVADFTADNPDVMVEVYHGNEVECPW
jgi:hypothetical protein